jgi:magnesium and cobalt exporter, CNNM family
MDLSVLPGLAPRLMLLGILLACSIFFSGSETALFSLSRMQRERMVRSVSSTERYVVALLRDPRRLIATILVGNELVNITFSSVLASIVHGVLPRSSELTLVLVSTCVTVPVMLLFGEITPKTVALRAAEAWAKVAARPIGAFTILVTPIRVVTSGIAGAVVHLLGGGKAPPRDAPIGEAEFRALVDAGGEEGTLEATERRLIHNVFKFGDRTVADVMTPARKVVSLSYDLPITRLVAEVARAGLSRIPIHRGRKEDVIGILYAKDLVGTSLGRLKGRTVKDLLRPPMYVPKTTKCDRLFREFQRKRTHLAMVVDEYGRLVGLVTMEDLLVALFGPLRDVKAVPDPMEGPETSAQQSAPSSGDGELS